MICKITILFKMLFLISLEVSYLLIPVVLSSSPFDFVSFPFLIIIKSLFATLALIRVESSSMVTFGFANPISTPNVIIMYIHD